MQPSVPLSGLQPDPEHPPQFHGILRPDLADLGEPVTPRRQGCLAAQAVTVGLLTRGSPHHGLEVVGLLAGNRQLQLPDGISGGGQGA